MRRDAADEKERERQAQLEKHRGRILAVMLASEQSSLAVYLVSWRQWTEQCRREEQQRALEARLRAEVDAVQLRGQSCFLFALAAAAGRVGR